MNHLELVRRHGFAVDDQENDIEGRCVAIAIPGPRVQYAISVSGITSRFPMSKTADVAREMREIVSELAEHSMPPIRAYPEPSPPMAVTKRRSSGKIRV